MQPAHREHVNLQVAEVPCPVCSSTQTRVCNRYTRWRNILPPCKITECGDCAMLFLSPRPREGAYEAFYSRSEGDLAGHLDSNFYLEYEERNRVKFLEILARIERSMAPAVPGSRPSILFRPQ